MSLPHITQCGKYYPFYFSTLCQTSSYFHNFGNHLWLNAHLWLNIKDNLSLFWSVKSLKSSLFVTILPRLPQAIRQIDTKQDTVTDVWNFYCLHLDLVKANLHDPAEHHQAMISGTVTWMQVPKTKSNTLNICHDFWLLIAAAIVAERTPRSRVPGIVSPDRVIMYLHLYMCCVTDHCTLDLPSSAS